MHGVNFQDKMDTAEKLMTAEKLESLLQQLAASDEDRILTLNIIDHYNVADNLMFFLLLKKRSRTSWTLWHQHAPIAAKQLLAFVDEAHALTFQYMIEIGAKNKVAIKQLQYFMDEFANHMLDVVKSHGYEALKKIEIVLTENHEHDEDGQPSES